MKFITDQSAHIAAITNTADQPRLLIIDPYIEGNKGHFFELSKVIGDASIEAGYSVTLLTHSAFDPSLLADSSITAIPVFTHRKIRKWSLGPHGYSRLPRDLNGKPCGGGKIRRSIQSLVDQLHGPSPSSIVEDTSRQLAQSLERLSPDSHDHLLVSTCDDFVLLIVTSALSSMRSINRINLHLLWHSPIDSNRECEAGSSKKLAACTAEQIHLCLRHLSKHKIHFWATTQELARQYNAKLIERLWKSVDYPIRDSFKPSINQSKHDSTSTDANHTATSRSLRVVCGGAMRSEKGGSNLATAVGLLWEKFFSQKRLRLGLQLPLQQATRLIPRKVATQKVPIEQVFELASQHMDAEAYRKWISQTDIGLFLYDSRRYYSRCSGVLVEMLACGVPVVVPAASWLSRQIAEVNQRHLMQALHQAVTRPIQSMQIAQPLSNLQANAWQATLDHSTAKRLLQLDIAGAHPASYVAVHISWSEFGQKHSRLFIQELLEGRAIIAVPRSFNFSNSMKSGFAKDHGIHERGIHDYGVKDLKLRCWSPFGQQGLRLASVLLHELPYETEISPIAIGNTYSRLQDLPFCFDELITNYDKVRQLTVEFSTAWRRKHSGLAFTERVLGTTVQSGNNESRPLKAA